MSGCDTTHDLEGEPVDALTSSPEASEPENEPSDEIDVAAETVELGSRVRDRISFS